MKRILCLLLIGNLLAGANAFGAEKGIKIKNWKGVETLDVATLQKNMADRVRTIVGVHFNWRGKDIHHMKPNWYECSIWQPKPDGKGFVDVRVMVAKKDLAAFKAITSDANSPEVLTVYGEVLRDSDAKFLFVRLMGRNATSDAKGDAMVTW